MEKTDGFLLEALSDRTAAAREILISCEEKGFSFVCYHEGG